jgi:REP element-mobilizing transposase RayT
MNYERKPHRLTNWDYSSDGIYYITICCFEKHSYLGTVCNNNVDLSEIGAISSGYWVDIPNHFPHVKLDEFIIMPNHIHGILILDKSIALNRLDVPDYEVPCHGIIPQQRKNINCFSQPIKNSVSVIINQYKSSVKRWCNKNGFTNFQWQSRFYDQILHNEIALEKVREYIHNNPQNWLEDDLYQS